MVKPLGSSSPSAGKRTKRVYTEKDRAKILDYYDKHGIKKTTKHFNVSDVSIYGWRSRNKKRTNGTGGGTGSQKIEMHVRVLAKKVRNALSARMKSTGDLNETELTALLLVKELLR